MAKKKSDRTLKQVEKHLKGDIKTFKHEAKEDKKLMKSIKDAHKAKHKTKHAKKHKKGMKKAVKALRKDIKLGKKESKVEKVMHEFKEGSLHSGSKKGPKVTSRKQAIAIGLSEGRKASKKRK